MPCIQTSPLLSMGDDGGGEVVAPLRGFGRVAPLRN